MTYTAADRNRARRLAYQRAWHEARRNGIPTSLVPADDAAAYLAALHQLGWSNRSLEHLTGGVVHRTTFSKLTRHNYAHLQRATNDGILSIPWTLAPPTDLPDECHVPTLGAQRRVQALLRAGWPHHLIRERAGGVDTTGTIRCRTRSIGAHLWRAVDDAYRELCMTPGPQKKCATSAARLGYAPALAWLDIDDPDETPTGVRPAKGAGPGHESVDESLVLRILAGDMTLAQTATTAERRAVVARWTRPLADLERLSGWKPERYRDGVAA